MRLKRDVGVPGLRPRRVLPCRSRRTSDKQALSADRLQKSAGGGERRALAHGNRTTCRSPGTPTSVEAHPLLEQLPHRAKQEPESGTSFVQIRLAEEDQRSVTTRTARVIALVGAFGLHRASGLIESKLVGHLGSTLRPASPSVKGPEQDARGARPSSRGRSRARDEGRRVRLWRARKQCRRGSPRASAREPPRVDAIRLIGSP